MGELRQYHLDFDGPLFRRQRVLLLGIAESVRRSRRCQPRPGDEDLLAGLLSLTDELADQAHDRHGIDCLLGMAPLAVANDEHDRCDCELPGFFCSGVPGILAHLESGLLAPGTEVERCDLCQRYLSDQAAFARLRELGHVPSPP